MCIIVDTNVAPTILIARSPQFAPVLNAILRGRHRLVYGGRLRDEFCRMTAVMNRMAVLERAGRVTLVPAVDIARAEQLLVDNRSCRSDDQHVIALAQVSGARVLCSKDHLLITDFRDTALLTPKGKVYKDVRCRHLVDRSCRRCRAR